MDESKPQAVVPEIEPGEAILASLGVKRVMSGKPLTPDEVQRGQGLADSLRGALGRYVRGERGGYVRGADDELPVRPPVETAAAVPDEEISTEVGGAATRALERLDTVIPRRLLGGLQDAQAQPTAAERAARRRARAVLGDGGIEAVIADLDTLGDDQLAFIRETMPTVAAALPALAMQALAENDRKLTKRQERALARIIQTGAPEVQAYQQMYAREAQEQAKAARGELATPTSQTPIQSAQQA